jgi:hypothetical protein
METRYWIKQSGSRSLAPEEVADLMFLAKGQRSLIADREIPLIVEQIDDKGMYSNIDQSMVQYLVKIIAMVNTSKKSMGISVMLKEAG